MPIVPITVIRRFPLEGEVRYKLCCLNLVYGLYSVVTANLSRKHFKEMQEDPRYSIWHPRYRVPVPIFGYSKPFAHRPPPDQM